MSDKLSLMTSRSTKEWIDFIVFTLGRIFDLEVIMAEESIFASFHTGYHGVRRYAYASETQKNVVEIT